MASEYLLSIYTSKLRGAACTALLAAGPIDNEDELLIVNGNEFLDSNFSEIINGFRQRKLDAGIVTFRAIHPRYSYVRLDDSELVVEAAEKKSYQYECHSGILLVF